MKKNYFSCYKKSDLLAGLAVIIVSYAVAALTLMGFYEIIDADADIHHHVTFVEALIGGAVCFIIFIITSVLGSMQLGELIRRIHINWIHRNA